MCLLATLASAPSTPARDKCQRSSQGRQSYLDAGQVQVHDTGHVETQAQHEQQQHNHPPEKSESAAGLEERRRRINAVASHKRGYVLRNHQQIDQAKEQSQDEGQHHGTGEVVVVHLVVLGGKKRQDASIPTSA